MQNRIKVLKKIEAEHILSLEKLRSIIVGTKTIWGLKIDQLQDMLDRCNRDADAYQKELQNKDKSRRLHRNQLLQLQEREKADNLQHHIEDKEQ